MNSVIDAPIMNHSKNINCDSKVTVFFENRLQLHELMKSGALSAKMLERAAIMALRLGYYEEAIICYERTIELNPNIIECYFGLGNCYSFCRHEYDIAIEYYKKYLYFKPDSSLGLYGLGYSLFYKKKYNQAHKKLLKAILLDSSNMNAIRYYLWSLFYKKEYGKMHDEAERLHQLHPGDFHIAYLAGLALGELGNIEKSLDWFKIADPELLHQERILFTLAGIYRKNRMYNLAIEAADKLLTYNQKSLKAFDELAQSHAILGNIETACGYCEKILHYEPDNYQIRLRLAIFQLYLSDYQNGWSNYEARLNLGVNRLIEEASNRWTMWRGENIHEKSILVLSEQGMGDVVQFSRYLVLLRRMVGPHGKIYFSIESTLASLLSPALSDVIFVNRVSTLEPDYYVALISLPLRFNTTQQTIPTPLLLNKIDLFRDNGLSKNFYRKYNIGIIWRGNPNNSTDYRRSIPLLQFLGSLPEHDQLYYHALLYKPSEAEIELLGSRSDIYDHSPEICTPRDVARLITQCDFIVSVDTLAAHIAGSLHIKTWLLIAYYPDWRWGKSGTSSAWYKAMTLYRQDNPYTWDGILEKLYQDLRAFVSIYMENSNG